MADVCFSKPVTQLSYNDENINYETGSIIEPPLSPSWYCVLCHYSAAGVPIWTKFGSL